MLIITKTRLAALLFAFVSVITFSPTLLANNQPTQTTISRDDILNTHDLITGVKHAVSTGDLDAINQWQHKAAEVAKAAGLTQADIDYIQSAYVKNYLVFSAKRSLFNDAVEQAYYTLGDITQIKQRYPEASDLFSQADQLIRERDNLIHNIAKELANGNPVTDKIIQQAKSQFMSRFSHKRLQKSH